MSLDFFVYSPHLNPITVHDLAVAARVDGWEVRALRDWNDWHDYQIVSDGDLLAGDMLCGWPSNDVRSATVAEVLEKHYERVLDRLLLQDAFGTCFAFLHSPDDFYADFSEAEREVLKRDDIEDDYHPRFLHGIFDPKLVYALNTDSHATGPIDSDFLGNAARWIARACSGAWCDPQADVHEICCVQKDTC